jgi:hypothetical protein
MIDDDAIQREIDGENTPAESARLMEELRQEPEARARYDELLRLSSALDSLPAADPPPGLLESVMRAVRAIARRTAAPPEGPWLILRAAFARRPVLGLGLSFAAGGLFALVLAGLSQPGRLPEAREAVGTVLDRERLESELASRASLEADAVRAVVRLETAPNRLYVRMTVESGPPLRLAARWNARALRPLGFERGDGPADTVAIGSDYWRIEGAGGGEYVLTLEALEPAPPALSVRLERGDEVVERELRVAGGS